MRYRSGVPVCGGCVSSSIVIVGNPDEVHVGRHLLHAAGEIGLDATLCDTNRAYSASTLRRAFNWRVRGRRPANLTEFSRQVVAECQARRPMSLVATGLAPVNAESMRAIGKMGIRRINYLTDDPWNEAHYAPWFMDVLAECDAIFTPRTANVTDLREAGCRWVEYLPFAYAPDIHFPDPPTTEDERQRFESDVVFAGGADDDRVAWMAPLISAGFRVALYGGYWDRHAETRSVARGMANAATLRKAIGGGATALCLVRRANRDGHSMRSFEVPAIGACMLVEDTVEHHQIFGEPGQAVQYVSSPKAAVERVGALLNDDCNRNRLNRTAHALITSGRHTWSDRLRAMLKEGPAW
jgi:spore maturation protein CgeB